MKLEIVNGRVIDPASGHDGPAGVFVEGSRIVAIGNRPAGWQADRSIDAAGLVVAPGLLDLSARMREPGAEGALKQEMRAALAGGVTGVVCPPDTDPPLDEPGLVRMLRQRSREAAGARIYPLGALTTALKGEALAELQLLHEVGCVAFMQTRVLPHDNSVLLQSMRYAATFDLPLWLRPVEDTLAGSGVAAAGPVAGRLGLPSIPAVAETVALHTIFELQRASGARVHLCRLSSAAGIELVRRAKNDGLRVTADVGIHHVHLVDVDIGYFDANYRLDPPLRSQRDRDAIVAGLADGTLDAICSGLEVLLPLVLKWARASQTPLVQALARVTQRPAEVLGEDTGRLRVDGKADIVVFDPDAHWQLTAESLVSSGRNSPFIGYELEGRARVTVVGGDVRFGA